MADFRGQDRGRGAGQVRVTVNGRSYRIGCDAGEEDRILDLAQYLNSRVVDLAGRVGQVGDERLLLMTALVLADDLAEAVAELETLRQDAAGGAKAPATASAEISSGMVPGVAPVGPESGSLSDPVLRGMPQRLERLAARMEDIAVRADSA